jgi:hypothetical protein
MWSISGCRVDISVETLSKITKIFGKPVWILTGYLQASSAASAAIHFGNLRIVSSATTYKYLHEGNAGVRHANCFSYNKFNFYSDLL